MTESKIAYLPFSAINEFMLPEFRQQVITYVLNQLEKLPASRRSAINSAFKQKIQLVGFRNSGQAPLLLRVRSAEKVFQKDADFAGDVIAAWVDLHPDLATRVHTLLTDRQWKLLPVNADRRVLPGFLTTWKKDESFEVVCQAYHSAYPDQPDPDDDISLMAVWLSGRLPYELEE